MGAAAAACDACRTLGLASLLPVSMLGTHPLQIGIPLMLSSHCLARFSLGQHIVEVTAEPDGALALWLDGCLRKRREAGGSGTYLWTNVELPFEDHHLVEVRRAGGVSAPIEVRINGHLEQRLDPDNARASG